MEGRETRRSGSVATGRPRDSDSARRFFALWPDDTTRAALAGLSRTLHVQCGGRRVPEHNIHLTLVFLGEVRADLVAALQQMAGELQSAPVDLVLNTTEYWRHNRIVCAGAKTCPPTLRELCARLGEGVRGLGIRTEARSFVPHVTLLRKAERAPAQPDSSHLVWHVSEFVLMQSVPRRDAVAYEMTGRWALAANADNREVRNHPAG